MEITLCEALLDDLRSLFYDYIPASLADRGERDREVRARQRQAGTKVAGRKSGAAMLPP